MTDPPPTVEAEDARPVSDDHNPTVDLDRWRILAENTIADLGATGALTLTFVAEDEIAALNAEHMGKDGPTDVLSFPMDDEPMPGVPTLLGDVVVCPEVADRQFAEHAGTYDDELALLIVHGILHVVGHDHAEPDETATMRSEELRLLEAHQWGGPAPAGFRQTHA